MIDILKIRYEAVIQSPTDTDFYNNVHEYIDWIVKTPQLNAVIEASAKEYRIKAGQIWEGKTGEKKDSEERSRQMYKLERFNLYASVYCVLEGRIYFPLEDYKTTNDPDYAQDPAVFLMLKGIKDIPRKPWGKLKNEMPNRWSLKNLVIINSWYAGMRKEYESGLKQFHTDFLTAVERVKNNNLPEVNNKIPLRFNSKTGDFSYFNTRGTLALGTNEYKIFSLLYSNTGIFVDYLKLYQVINNEINEVRKYHKETLSQVIRNLKEKLEILPKDKAINPDIFENTPKGGYRLISKDRIINTE